MGICLLFTHSEVESTTRAIMHTHDSLYGYDITKFTTSDNHGGTWLGVLSMVIWKSVYILLLLRKYPESKT